MSEYKSITKINAADGSVVKIMPKYKIIKVRFNRDISSLENFDPDSFAGEFEGRFVTLISCDYDDYGYDLTMLVKEE